MYDYQGVVTFFITAEHRKSDKPYSEPMPIKLTDSYIDGLVQNRSIVIANVPKIMQSCSNPSICATDGQLDRLCL